MTSATTKFNSQDIITKEKSNAKNQGKTIVYEYFYLTVVILDLLLGAVGLLTLGEYFITIKKPDGFITKDSEDPGEGFWLAIIISLLFQFFGWKGYLYNHTKSVKIFAAWRIILGLLGSLSIFTATDPGTFILQVIVLIFFVTMAYLPMKFLRGLESIHHIK